MKNKSIVFIIMLFVTSITADQISKCITCGNDFHKSFKFCPYDGNQLQITKTETKDIEGYQKYIWGITLDSTKQITDIETTTLNSPYPEFSIFSIINYEFQGKSCLLKLEFYKDALYKASIHFTTEANQASVNDYFARTRLISEVYGSTKKIAIGRESDDASSRLTSMKIDALTYQHRWNSVSGELLYQIGSGSYGEFIHSLFYSSIDADVIDNNKSKSEF